MTTFTAAQDPANDLKDCPGMIQERYNRFHMMQHQTGLERSNGKPVLPSRVTRTCFSKKPKTNVFGMVDQMLRNDPKDNDDSSVSSNSDDSSSADDDDVSCLSSASYHSLNFGDDGVNFKKSQKPSMDDEDTDSWNGDSDVSDDNKNDDFGLDVAYIARSDEDDDDDEVRSFGSVSSDLTIDYPPNGVSLVGGSCSSPLSPYNPNDGSDMDPPYQNPLVKGVVTDNPDSRHELVREKHIKSVRWSENVKVRPIRHVNDFSDEEIITLFLTRKEADNIRKDAMELIQLLEREQELLENIRSKLENDADLDAVSFAFHKNLMESSRGLERHTMQRNENTRSKRDQLYACVFKIQAVDRPVQLMMDIPATIAEVCSKITESCVNRAIELASLDEQEAYHEYYGAGQLLSS